MKSRILTAVLSTCISTFTLAQSTPNTAYAITSKTYGAHEWTEVKEISLVNGEVVRNVFENSNVYNVFDARSGRSLAQAAKNDSTAENKHHPFSGLSAACAYDANLNRLYYAPMFENELRYIDLASPVTSVYMFRSEQLSNADDQESEANQVTRMVIGADGNGYALNNDGKHLVRFTTEEKPVITDLGSLHDAPENGEVSIHDANTSWGGDMLADASSNLYLISAANYVFRIDIRTKTATYITRIKGLPVSFTTNGAVVNDEGNIVISSANSLTSYYTVEPRSWQATSLEPRQQIYNTSDLANQNLLFKTNLKGAESLMSRENISVYPNPVKSKSFRVSFANKATGKYNVQLVDVTGRTVSDKALAVYDSTQSSEVRVDPALTRGMYFVKIVDSHRKEIFTRKIIIE